MEYLVEKKDLVSVLYYIENEGCLDRIAKNILNQQGVNIDLFLSFSNEIELTSDFKTKVSGLFGEAIKSLSNAKDWDEACFMSLEKVTGEYVVFGDCADEYLDADKLYKQVQVLKNEKKCVGVSHRIQSDSGVNVDAMYCMDNRYTKGQAQKFMKTSPLSAIVFKNTFTDKFDWKYLFTTDGIANDERKILVHATKYGYILRLDDRMMLYTCEEKSISNVEYWSILKTYINIYTKTWDKGRLFDQKTSLALKALQSADDENIVLFKDIIATLPAKSLTDYQKWEIAKLIYSISWRMESNEVLRKQYKQVLTDCNKYLDEFQIACILLKCIRLNKKRFALKIVSLNRSRIQKVLYYCVMQARKYSQKATIKIAKKGKRFIGKRILEAPLRKVGFSEYMAHEWLTSLQKDMFEKNNIPFRKKLWAWKHGFLSYRIEQYGLTESNLNNYLSDRDYMWLHPINNSYKKWIDDKYTMRVMLEPFKDYLPEYYYHIIKRNGETVFVKLQDCPEQYGDSLLDILNLLREKKVLALKPAAGTHGAGFYKLSSDGVNYYVNDEEKQISDIQILFRKFDCFYILTEYIDMHDQIKEIYPGSVNTIRMMTINRDGKSPKIMNAYMRLGSSKTGFTDNVAYGGVFAQIDLIDGRYFNPEQSKNHVIHSCPYHPDTNTKIEGYLPNWELVMNVVPEIANYLAQLEYLGFDIVLTPSGFKILEINVHQDLHRYPNYGEEVHEYFMYKLEQKKKRYNRKW